MTLELFMGASGAFAATLAILLLVHREAQGQRSAEFEESIDRSEPTEESGLAFLKSQVATQRHVVLAAIGILACISWMAGAAAGVSTDTTVGAAPLGFFLVSVYVVLTVIHFVVVQTAIHLSIRRMADGTDKRTGK